MTSGPLVNKSDDETHSPWDERKRNGGALAPTFSARFSTPLPLNSSIMRPKILNFSGGRFALTFLTNSARSMANVFGFWSSISVSSLKPIHRIYVCLFAETFYHAAMPCANRGRVPSIAPRLIRLPSCLIRNMSIVPLPGSKA